eukprot:GHVO01066444.1.p1 GENE.GHVO01066444.1~~GHVO01066444.1.p1  ORF type:complete len:317 (-),score=57.46 GHVO01066444.1:368-1282(-)
MPPILPDSAKGGNRDSLLGRSPSNLTLDDIRKELRGGLRGSGFDEIENKKPDEQGWGGAPNDLDAMIEAKKNSCTKLANMAAEILVYCHMVESTRLRAVEEAGKLRETVRDLENLLDAARNREKENLDEVEQRRLATSEFDHIYVQLKEKLKALLRQCAEAKDTSHASLESGLNRVKDTEAQLIFNQSIVKTQRVELDRLMESQTVRMSETALSELNAKLKRLELENATLAAEKQHLERQLETRRGKECTRNSINSLQQTLRSKTQERSEQELLLQSKLARVQQQAKELRARADVLLEKHDLDK